MIELIQRRQSLENRKNLLIGIDTGVNTGVAIYDSDKMCFLSIQSMTILKAIKLIDSVIDDIVVVYVEDARQVKYKTSRYKAQGAGSVKRDCGIWEEFLNDRNINSNFVRPNKKITKIDSNMFKRITKWDKVTNEHGRDAAMMIFGLKGIIKLKR